MSATTPSDGPASPAQAPGAAVEEARRAFAQWCGTALEDRLALLRAFRRRLVLRSLELAQTVALPQRRGPAETLTAEVLPLLDACRFLERTAPKVLAPRSLGVRRRPVWLMGCRTELRREPLGVVLVIGPSNYPILLPGVQVLQALAAGNAVVLKPGAGGGRAARFLCDELAAVGLPEGVLRVLGEDAAEAIAAIDGGVDKVVLTGSAETGRAVLADLARTATPAVMELSGCDPVLVLKGADARFVAAALRFGLLLNGGFTCIAPRRVYAHRDLAESLEARLCEELRNQPAVALPAGVGETVSTLVNEALGAGARLVAGSPPENDSMAPLVLADPPPGSRILEADVPAPILSLVRVESGEQAVELSSTCPYRLGSAIFGDENEARALAERLPAGVVVINDVVVPTADPRLPFGGRRASGFGVTRGTEGLLEMTVLKAVVLRRGRFRPHYEPSRPGDEQLFAAYARAAHGAGVRQRLRAMTDLLRLGSARRKIKLPADSQAARSTR
jgi:acyl-CoA reductase-like NAD-dependent aldehyde dehydrogenase